MITGLLLLIGLIAVSLIAAWIGGVLGLLISPIFGAEEMEALLPMFVVAVICGVGTFTAGFLYLFDVSLSIS